MDVGQQLEDLQNGSMAIEVLVKEWNGRLQGIDWPAVQKFRFVTRHGSYLSHYPRSEFGASKGLQYLLDTLLFAPRLSNVR